MLTSVSNLLTGSEAKTYCEWLDRELCTEAQWEKAARGGCETNGGPQNCKAQSRIYPWGNTEPTCETTVMDDGEDGCGTGGTFPVCSKSPLGDSPYGVCDMAGNVSEWVGDYHYKDYYCVGPMASGDQQCVACGAWPDAPNAWVDPEGPVSGIYRALRGGCAFTTEPKFQAFRASQRISMFSSAQGWSVGLRCCQ